MTDDFSNKDAAFSPRRCIAGCCAKVRQLLHALLKTTMVGLFTIICQLSAWQLYPIAMAGPVDGTIVGGQGGIERPDANTTIIRQESDRMAIDWRGFDVGSQESVKFQQPSSSSAALNRVTGANPSSIMGSISANGKVFLINPNGMVFGNGARVNVGAFVGSGLDIKTSDFMAGRNNFFTAGKTGGKVVNRGTITAATGGSVNLVGGVVENAGTIIADGGYVNLGVGKTATIDFEGDGLVRFAVSGAVDNNADDADAAVANTGTIQANGGHVLLSATAARNVFAKVVNNTGIIEAGRIENSGGVVRLTGTGGPVSNSGTIDVSAQGGSGDAGSVTMTSDDLTTLYGEGQILSRSVSGRGGNVQILGDRVSVTDNVLVDVSGETGGGTVLIGGDYQGKNPEIKNATRTFVGDRTEIKADAINNGDGGTVVVWSNNTTQFNGAISARGGAKSGDGGFVEVSGKQNLGYTGDVDTSAVNGDYGTLLLDPTNITIADGGSAALTAVDNFADAGATTSVDAATINGAATNVVLQATNDITFSEAINITTQSIGLTAQAGGNITVGTSITTNGGAVSLNANDAGGTQTGAGYIDLNAAIDTTAGGQITLNVDGGTGNIQLGANLSTNQGAVQLQGPVILDAPVTIDTGQGANVAFSSTVDGPQNLTITAGTGTITFAGNVGTTTPVGNAVGYALDFTTTGLTSFVGTVTTASGITMGDVTFNEDVTLGDGNTATSFAGDVTLAGLTMTYADGITFGNQVADQLTVSAGAVTITSSNNGNALFTGLVDGNQDLTVNAGNGTTSFSANIGASSPLGDAAGAALTVASTGLTTFNGNVTTQSGISVAGDVTFGNDVTLGTSVGDTPSTFNGNVNIPGVTITYANGITFGNDANDNTSLSGGSVTIQTSNDGFIVFNGPVDGAVNLTINSGADPGITSTFLGNVGATTPIGTGTGVALNLLSTGNIVFRGTVTTASGITALGHAQFYEDVTIGDGSVGTSFNGDVTLGGMNLTYFDSIAFGDSTNDSITLADGPVNITSTDVDVLFNGLIDGPQDLTVNVGTGTTTFQGNIGNSSAIGDAVGPALNSLSTGDVTFNGTLGTRSGINIDSNATFTDTIILGDGDTATTLNGNTTLSGLSLSYADGITFGNAITDQLTIDTNSVAIRSSNNGNAIFNGPVDGGQDLTLDTGSGTATFVTNVGSTTSIGDSAGASIIIASSGPTNFNGTVQGESGITAIGPGTVTFFENVTLANGDTGSSFAGNVGLSGMTYSYFDGVTFGDANTDAVTLSASPVAITNTDGSNTTFSAQVNGPQDLTIDSKSGTTTFNANVGSSAAIGDSSGAAITLTSTGPTLFNTTLNTSSGITAVGDVTFRDTVVLGDGNSATSLNSNVILDGLTLYYADGITFGNATTDQITLSDDDVTINTLNNANVVFAGIVDGAQDLIINTSIGSTTFQANVGSSTPIGDGTGAALRLTSSLGSATFVGTLATASGISSAGPVIFNENVTFGSGDTETALNSDATLNGLTMTYANGVTFGNDTSDRVTLAEGPVTINATSDANLYFYGPVDGRQDLAINAGSGTTTFVSAVGSTNEIGVGNNAAITLSSSGATNFNSTVTTASGMSTAGPVTFTENVILGNGNTASTFSGDTTLSGMTLTYYDGITFGDTPTDNVTLAAGNVAINASDGANAVFAALVDGAQDLSINTGTGSATFSAGVGSIVPIGDATGAAITATSTGDTIFNGTLATASGITTTGAATFAENVTLGDGDTPTTLNGNVTLSGMTLTYADNITFGDALTDQVTLLAGPAVINASANNNMLFSGLLDGAQNLTLSAGTGSITANSTVGGATPISQFAATAGLIDLQNLNTSGPVNMVGNLVNLENVVAGGPINIIANQIDVAAITGGGTIDLTGDEIELRAAVTGGATTLQPRTANLPIIVGGTASTSALDISALEIARLDGVTSLTIGRSDGSGNITVSDGVYNPLTSFRTTGTLAFVAINDDSVLFNNGFDTTGAANTTMVGNILTSGDAITLNGLQLVGTTLLDTTNKGANPTGAAIAITGALDGNSQDLTVDAGQSTVTVTGAVSDLGDGVGAALTVPITSTGLVRFENTFAAKNGVVAGSTSNIQFDDNVTLEVNADTPTQTTLLGNVTLNGLNWSSYHDNDPLTDDPLTLGAVTLSGGPVSLNSNGANILIGSLTGAQDLTLADGVAAGTTTVTGAVNNLGDGVGAALTVGNDVTGPVRLQSTVEGNSGIVSAGPGSTLQFNKNVTLQKGDTSTTFGGNVEFNGPLDFKTNGGDISFATLQALPSGGAVNLDTGGGRIRIATLQGPQNFTLGNDSTADGTAIVIGTVDIGDVNGNGPALNVKNSISGLIEFEGKFTATSGIIAGDKTNLRFDDDVTLGDGNDPTNLAGNVTLDGLKWESYDGITFGKTILSGGPVTLDSKAGNIELGSLEGAQDLILAEGIGVGTTTIAGTTSNLGDGVGAALVINDAVTGLVKFKGAVTANSGITTIGNNHSIQFDENVTLANGDTATDLAGNVTLNGLDWSSFDDITFGATTLAGGPVSIDSNSGNININSLSGAQDLTLKDGIEAGTTTIAGVVDKIGDGVGAALTVENKVTGLVHFLSKFDANSGLQAGSNTDLSFDDNVTLVNGDTGTALDGKVALNGLNWNSYDGIEFGVTTFADGPVKLDSNGGNIIIGNLNGGKQDLKLAAGINKGTTTFAGTIQDLGDGEGASLEIDKAVTGDVKFLGEFSGNSGLSSGVNTTLEFDKNVTVANGDTDTILAGPVILNGIKWDSFGDITLGPTTLAGGPVSISSNDGSIEFASLTGPQNLIIAQGSTGTISVIGDVTNVGDGTGKALTISQSAIGLVRFYGLFNINSGMESGNDTTIRFDDDVTVNNDVSPTHLAGHVILDGLNWNSYRDITLGETTLSGGPVNMNTNHGNLNFVGVVDGAQPLTINTGMGNITVMDNIGDTIPLTNLTATAKTMAAHDITTTGAQTYNADLVLDGKYTTSNANFTNSRNITLLKQTPFYLGAGSMLVDGNINGNQDLAVQAQNITLNGINKVTDVRFEGGGKAKFNEIIAQNDVYFLMQNGTEGERLRAIGSVEAIGNVNNTDNPMEVNVDGSWTCLSGTCYTSGNVGSVGISTGLTYVDGDPVTPIFSDLPANIIVPTDFAKFQDNGQFSSTAGGMTLPQDQRTEIAGDQLSRCKSSTGDCKSNNKTPVYQLF